MTRARSRSTVLALLLALTAGAALAQRSYVVRPGDTLYALAGRFDTTVAALMSANRLSSDVLSVGQVLTLPTAAAVGYRIVFVRAGETLAELAQRVGRNAATLRSANPGLAGGALPAGAAVSVPPGDGVTVFAQAGDTARALAVRAGLDPADVADANGVGIDAPLPAGRALLLPASAAASPAEAAAGTRAAAAPATTPTAPGAAPTDAASTGPAPTGAAPTDPTPTGTLAAGPTPTGPVRAATDVAGMATGVGGGAAAGDAAATGGTALAGVGGRERLRGLQDAALRDAVARLGSVSFTSPTFEAPVHGRISSRFGWRTLSVNGNHFHAGVDLAAPMGTPVHAARDGTVVKAGWGGSYGNVVFLDHGDGTQTRYAHLSRIDVRVGETVRQGDVLGLVGSTGASTGPHVHFELRFDGRAVDPLAYLEGAGSP